MCMCVCECIHIYVDVYIYIYKSRGRGAPSEEQRFDLRIETGKGRLEWHFVGVMFCSGDLGHAGRGGWSGPNLEECVGVATCRGKPGEEHRVHLRIDTGKGRLEWHLFGVLLCSGDLGHAGRAVGVGLIWSNSLEWLRAAASLARSIAST